MWGQLPNDQKELYERLITNFASLSEAFAQKTEDEESIVPPIVNSKFQETAFQKSFNATGEDIGNTSYDASIDHIDDKIKKRFLIGIKTFGLNSGDQKIAQFKAISADQWTEIIDKIKENSKGLSTKKDINKINHDLYLSLAKKIATVRNSRIRSSEENIKGFKNRDHISVEAVYHVLMPTPKNNKPEILVGETTYMPIDLESIAIDGCTGVRNPTNFIFHDINHCYKYTSADSQLLMSFNNKNMVLEKWPVTYVKDAFKFFENMSEDNLKRRAVPVKTKISESHSWYIEIKPYSGYNAFYGQSKMGRENEYREKRIKKFENDYSDIISKKNLDYIIDRLKVLLLKKWTTKEDKDRMVTIRLELMHFITQINNQKIKKDVGSMVYRPADELEIRIPKSTQFHQQYPNFFVKNIFISGSKKYVRDKELRTFKLMFLPSNDVINAYVNQQNRKAIESVGSQKILGKWILRDVFQLKEYEPLTYNKLNEIGINGIRFIKKSDHIELQFIWIDSENEPDDIWK
nr:hypothetical protein [Liquorilactobacillus uvarum]